ncbi:MAG: hypothetical protein A2Z24_02205 [Candidatus Woykebacteria bacterium RBG_16_44_10]|uniref:5'-nucleotidase n=1 Tax=Candidatus Woykebacteria bacterium RBG_16_44_10 TaxID=1802597 RepID=A0A1G1WGP3_9BACT|nr:MAG: hypothetical protein A2Z24_02205 [Candidatus Woykebacteria bacterium RBG_16_44_10]
MTRKTISFSNDSSLGGFLYQNRSRILTKLNSFISAGKDKLHLVLDFDRTLTLSQNRFGENVTTWEILKGYLTPSGQKEYQRFYDFYRRLEVENQLKRTHAVEWWEGVLNLFIKERLKRSSIEHIVARDMPARSYARELFSVCQSKGIPTIIISAGIKDVIDIWCKSHVIKPTKVLATKLFFSPKGFVRGWYRNSFIYVLNKREKGHAEISNIRSGRPNTILIGDDVYDSQMVDGKENVIRIMVHDPRKDAADESDYKLLQKFDLLIKTGDLLPVIKLLELFP